MQTHCCDSCSCNNNDDENDTNTTTTKMTPSTTAQFTPHATHNYFITNLQTVHQYKIEILLLI
eukprot:m.23880 g.23880  ORF g.23880 m.23880 type:complete len:63 (+) comp7551_c0_seq1:3077-3265(+)